MALAGQAAAATDGEWDQVARCESGGNWAINTGNGYHGGGRRVVRLEYSAHPSAEQVIADVVADIAEQSSGVRAVAASHRIGALRIGEAALVAAVAADHRQAAFATCAHLVDTIKARLPVWKHQFFADGTEEWVGSA
ncbi:molybdenum cofactor biosynthesis protein MoaE [Mycobacterium colombiense]|nr:molybdenum cofactor biosynthesis protein MoaE [Mycobacterium colombiense]